MQISQENISVCVTDIIETSYKAIFEIFKVAIQHPNVFTTLLDYFQNYDLETLENKNTEQLANEIMESIQSLSLIDQFKNLEIRENSKMDINSDLRSPKIEIAQKGASEYLALCRTLKSSNLANLELFIEVKRWFSLIKLTDDYLSRHRPFYEKRDRDHLSTLPEIILFTIFLRLSKKALTNFGRSSKFFQTTVSSFKSKHSQFFARLPESDFSSVCNQYYLTPTTKTTSHQQDLPLWTLADGEICRGEKFTLDVVANQSGQYIYQNLQGHSAEINAAVALNNNDFASASDDTTIKIWRLGIQQTDEAMISEETAYHCTQTLSDHTGPVRALTHLSSGELVSCSRDKTIKVWQLIDGQYQCMQTLNSSCDFVFNLPSVAGFGTSCYEDKYIRIWTPLNGEYHCSQILKGHTATPNCAITTHSGFLVSSSIDLGYIKIWKLQNGKFECIQTMLEAGGMLLKITALPEGSIVAYPWTPFLNTIRFPTLESKLQLYLDKTYPRKNNVVNENDRMIEDEIQQPFKRRRI